MAPVVAILMQAFCFLLFALGKITAISEYLARPKRDVVLGP